MRSSLSLLFGLGSLVVAPALPDIITDVTVNGVASGTESITVACGNATPGCVDSSATFLSSFDETNTQIGSFTATGSVATPPPFFNASVSNFATQDTSATANVLSLLLRGGLSANSTAPSFSWSESDSITMNFDVTVLSQAKFSGEGGELLDSQGNVILMIPNSPSGASLELEPGMYQLAASAHGGGFGAFANPSSTTDFVFSVTGIFSPVATPEPRTTSLAALFAALLGGYIASRFRRRAAD